MKINKNVYQKGKGETGEEWDKVARLLQIYLIIVTYLWKIISIGFQCIVLLSGSYFSTHKEYLCSFLALIPPNQVSGFTCGSSQEYHLQTSGQRACCLPCLCPRCSDHLHLCSEVLYSSWMHAWQTAAASQTSMLIHAVIIYYSSVWWCHKSQWWTEEDWPSLSVQI